MNVQHHIYFLPFFIFLQPATHACVDVIFLIDGTIQNDDYFQKTIKIIENVTKNFDIENNKQRIGLIQFTSAQNISKWPKYFGNIESKATLLSILNTIRRTHGTSDAGHALELVLGEFVPQRRVGLPMIVYTLTDGIYRRDHVVIENAKKLASNSNMHLIASTISTPYDRNGLLQLVNGNPKRVFIGDSIDKNILRLLKQVTNCEMMDAPVEPSLVLLKSSSSSNQELERSSRIVRKAERKPASQEIANRYKKRTKASEQDKRTKNSDCIVDMVLVMDFSGGTIDVHDAYINISSQLIEPLNLSSLSVQVAMVRYSGPGRADTVFHLNKHNSSKKAILDIQRANHIGGITYTGQAIEHAIKEFNNEFGGRDDAKKMIILFTDGYSQEDPLPAADSATKTHIDIHAVAVDNELVKPNIDQLVTITQKPENVYANDAAVRKFLSKFHMLLKRC